MMPRAVHTRNVIWYTGSGWGVGMGGLAVLLSMYLYGVVSGIRKKFGQRHRGGGGVFRQETRGLSLEDGPGLRQGGEESSPSDHEAT